MTLQVDHLSPFPASSPGFYQVWGENPSWLANHTPKLLLQPALGLQPGLAGAQRGELDYPDSEAGIHPAGHGLSKVGGRDSIAPQFLYVGPVGAFLFRSAVSLHFRGVHPQKPHPGAAFQDRSVAVDDPNHHGLPGWARRGPQPQSNPVTRSARASRPFLERGRQLSISLLIFLLYAASLIIGHIYREII